MDSTGAEVSINTPVCLLVNWFVHEDVVDLWSVIGFMSKLHWFIKPRNLSVDGNYFASVAGMKKATHLSLKSFQYSFYHLSVKATEVKTSWIKPASGEHKKAAFPPSCISPESSSPGCHSVVPETRGWNSKAGVRGLGAFPHKRGFPLYSFSDRPRRAERLLWCHWGKVKTEASVRDGIRRDERS